MGLNGMINKGKQWTKAHASELFTGAGLLCFAAGTGLAVTGTIKALDLIDEEKERRINDYSKNNELTPEKEAELTDFTTKDYILACWKVYSPAALSILLGSICIINANRINVKRTAAVTAAYTLSETALREFKNKAVEVIGENKVEEIKQEIVQDKLSNNPYLETDQPVMDNQIVMTYKNEVLCCESTSMRYFKISQNDIKAVENKINYIMRTQDFCSLSQYYDLLHLEHTDISDSLGWSLYKDGEIELRPITAAASNGEPCLYLEFNVMPRYAYNY